MKYSMFLALLARPVAAMSHATRTTAAAPSIDASATAENDRPAQPLWLDVTRTRSGVAALHARVVHVVLSDGLRAQMLVHMTDDDAATWGQRMTTVDLLDDLLDDVPGVVDDVLAGKLPGFGPRTLRYTLDLAQELVGCWSSLVAHRGARTAAASKKALSIDEVLACRTELSRRMSDVIPAAAPERAALDHASALRVRTLAAGLNAVEAMLPLVAGVFEKARADHDFKDLLDDVQFTPASIAKLLAPVEPSLAARSAHRDARNLTEVTQRRIDRLEGRVRDRLMLLRQRVQVARDGGALMPEVRMARTLTRRPGAKASVVATPPQDAPSPAAAPQGDGQHAPG